MQAVVVFRAVMQVVTEAYMQVAIKKTKMLVILIRVKYCQDLCLGNWM